MIEKEVLDVGIVMLLPFAGPIPVTVVEIPLAAERLISDEYMPSEVIEMSPVLSFTGDAEFQEARKFEAKAGNVLLALTMLAAVTAVVIAVFTTTALISCLRSRGVVHDVLSAVQMEITWMLSVVTLAEGGRPATMAFFRTA